MQKIKNDYEFSFLGAGHNGKVYMLPDGNIVKIFFSKKTCRKEYEIFEKVYGNAYYPKVYEYGSNYIIRQLVRGTCLKDYIKNNGINTIICENLINLLIEFKRLGFSKIDIRCKDIFIEDDFSLHVIDPKDCFSKYRDYPQHLSKGLYKLGVLDFFMDVLKKSNLYLYNKWSDKIYSYLKIRFKEY